MEVYVPTYTGCDQIEVVNPGILEANNKKSGWQLIAYVVEGTLL